MWVFKGATLLFHVGFFRGFLRLRHFRVFWLCKLELIRGLLQLVYQGYVHVRFFRGSERFFRVNTCGSIWLIRLSSSRVDYERIYLMKFVDQTTGFWIFFFWVAVVSLLLLLLLWGFMRFPMSRLNSIVIVASLPVETETDRVENINIVFIFSLRNTK